MAGEALDPFELLVVGGVVPRCAHGTNGIGRSSKGGEGGGYAVVRSSWSPSWNINSVQSRCETSSTSTELMVLRCQGEGMSLFALSLLVAIRDITPNALLRLILEAASW